MSATDPAFVFDVTDREFETKVVARSHEVPVVVDLWAPWCGPCKMLGPVLQAEVTARGGSVELASLNVDDNPLVAAQLGAQSIPLVVAFVNGKRAAQFVGARDARFIKQWLDALVPSRAAAALAAAEKALAEGKADIAIATFRQLLADAAVETEVAARAALLLAGALLERGETDELGPLLDRAERSDPSKVESLRRRVQLLADANAYGGEAKARAALAVSEADLEARWALGCALASRGDHAGALEQFLEIVTRSRKFKADAARLAMLALFDGLGPDSDLTRDYRRKLQIVL